MNLYSVTLNGAEVFHKVTKDTALKYAMKLYNSGKTNVGIMKFKMKNNKLVYNHLPLYYYV